MKKIFCLLLGLLIAASNFAQTNAPAKAEAKPAGKKKSAAKKAPPQSQSAADELRTIPLVPGPATVVASNVNVRARAGLVGEVLTRISKDAMVTVVEEVTLKHSQPDEPSAWAKIILPPGARTYVNAGYVDATNKTVKPKKLNVRGGAGENYGVIGVLQKGAVVKEIAVNGDWMEIEPPDGVFGFVAAQYLKQEPPAIVTTTAAKPPEPAPTPAPVTEPPVAKPVTTEAPTPAPKPVETPPPTPVTTPPPIAAPEPVPTTTPETPEQFTTRIVQHEGIVKGTWSIQAPTKFALVDPESGKTINYLFTTSTNLDLRRWKGLHIVVTGEEGLDARWRNTPVLTIQRIQLLE